MPNVVMDFLQGRTIEQKREMVRRVTDAISETLKCPPETVQIIIHEISQDQIANGGELLCDKNKL